MVILGINIQDYLIKGFLWTRIKWVYHSLFWVLMLWILVIIGNERLSLPFRILLESVNILFYIVVTYINLGYLIPNFLSDKKQEWTFIGALLLVCAVLTPLKVAALYFLHDQFPTFQHELLKNQLWYFLGLVYIAGFSTIYSIIAEWKKQERQRKELQNQTVESELRFLKTQINPHFLFNTLNSLYALTLKKSDDAPDVVLQLSEMMRYMLYECNEPQVPLAKEISYIENYLNLERRRLSSKINISMEVNGNFSEIKVVPLLFIPFIENSFKHGIANQIGEGYVFIKLEVTEKGIDFMIQNSKTQKPLLNLSGKKSGGIGLVNVRRRLDLLYPEKNNLEITESPELYLVELKLLF